MIPQGNSCVSFSPIAQTPLIVRNGCLYARGEDHFPGRRFFDIRRRMVRRKTPVPQVLFEMDLGEEAQAFACSSWVQHGDFTNMYRRYSAWRYCWC